MIPVFQKDETLLADLRTKASFPGLYLWWLGQSGFLVQWQGRRLLLDPYLSDSLTEKYRHTDKPHIRMSERVLDPALLTGINVVTSSHNHTDHLDAATLLPLFAANPGIRLVIPEANRAFVCDRLGCAPDFPVGLNDGQSFTLEQFTLHAVPAAHNQVDRDAEGRCKYLGYVLECGPFHLYHSGDTLWYPEMEALLRPWHLDVALLPINGNRPERRVAGNLSAEEAARLGQAIGAKCVVPHHFHLFEFNTEDPAVFEEQARRYGAPYRVLRIGEGMSVG